MDRLRRTGMSISQMRQYTALVKQGNRTLQQRQKLLGQHRARVTQTIAEWTQALELIDSKMDFYGQWLATGKRPRLPAVESRQGSVPAKKLRGARAANGGGCFVPSHKPQNLGGRDRFTVPFLKNTNGT